MIVGKSLLSWLDQIGFLPDVQVGLIPGGSVAMAVTVAQNDWLQAKAKNKTVGVLGSDLSVTFDASTLTSCIFKVL